MTFIINNGDEAKSNVTGFKGTVIARSEHLYGCNRYFVQPKMNKEGNVPDGMWYDEAELIVTKKVKNIVEKKNTGGFPHRMK